jgi:uncharacterized membrane protein
MAEDVVEKEAELATIDGTANETDELTVKVPTKPETYKWVAVLAKQETAGIIHEGDSPPFSFVVKPHTTSIAIWDVPSPVVFGTRFTIKAGVSCSAHCNLAGKEVEIHDHEGARTATGILGDVQWPKTRALYWAEVELGAPRTDGHYTWKVKFPKPEMALPHEEAASTFAFMTAGPPEHAVTVEVIDKDMKTPIKNAIVVLNAYKGYTDENGVARVSVPKGEYKVDIAASGKRYFQTTVKVVSDTSVKAELSAAKYIR